MPGSEPSRYIEEWVMERRFLQDAKVKKKERAEKEKKQIKIQGMKRELRHDKSPGLICGGVLAKLLFVQ
jgi:hypothetical protein